MKGKEPTASDLPVETTSSKQANGTEAVGATPATSMIESIPSQTGDTLGTSGSENFLALLDETFDTSVTGVRGTSKKPYQRKPKCSNTNHVDKCAECETIEKELNLNESPVNEEHKKETESKDTKQKDCNLTEATVQPIAAAYGPSENVWQVDNIEKYDTFSKLNLSPITILSSRDDGAAATGNSTSTIDTGIDSTSFIVLRNDEHLTHFFPNITTTGTSTTSGNNLFYSKNSSASENQRPCFDCCFCNPALHHRNNTSPKTCNYCSSCRQTRRDDATPANDPFSQPTTNINQLNNGATDRGTTHSNERLYESRFRSNHKHVRTRSRESGIVSTNCTRHSNRKVRQIAPATDDVTNGNAKHAEQPQPTEPKNNNIRETQNETEKTSKKSSIPKLPPCEWSSNSCETNTNPPTSSSTSTDGSSPRMRRRQDSKSVPNLPMANRNQNLPKPKNSSTKTRTNSRYQHFYGDGETNDVDKAVVNSTDSKKANIQQGEITQQSMQHFEHPFRSSHQITVHSKRFHTHCYGINL